MRVLAINDLSCVGKCSLTVALPIISACGVTCDVLPTALLSTHTGGFTNYTFRDLTEDFAPTLKQWSDLRLAYDIIYCGYLGNAAQAEYVEKFKNALLKKDGVFIVDPVLGDNGKLYPGFNASFVAAMKRLCAQADYILPNVTEACALTGNDFSVYDKADSRREELFFALLNLCPHPVLTGADEKDGMSVYYAGGADKYKKTTHEKIDGAFHGSGDVFASVFTGLLAAGKNMEYAVKSAADFTCRCIANKKKSGGETRYGLDFEEEIPFLVKLTEK
ncbi:MAG: pyridoxamine kinase [Candidatus Borkfalkiaceae bacterium]|nr:pyridoxamine kinase [Clostridia bacterium]MDY6224037.1 pyridoxamine kinase [Christensenellaceae bacterium]